MESKEFAKKLGIKIPVGLEEEKVKMLCDEAVDDINIMMQAKANVKSDMKAMGIKSEEIAQGKPQAKKSGVYCGKDPVSGEKIYK